MDYSTVYEFYIPHCYSLLYLHFVFEGAGFEELKKYTYPLVWIRSKGEMELHFKHGVFLSRKGVLALEFASGGG